MIFMYMSVQQEFVESSLMGEWEMGTAVMGHVPPFRTHPVVPFCMRTLLYALYAHASTRSKLYTTRHNYTVYSL
jgi:hypothetical protein